VRSVLSDLRFRAQTSWRVEAAEAVAALPLVAEIGNDALSDLAGRVRRRRVREGEAVIRQGEAGGAFFVVRRGRFAVVELDDAGSERTLRRAGPGASFGELALLEHRPRTATVRAETAGELFEIDAGTFQRVIAPAMTTPDLAPALRPLLEVWALQPFRHLDQRDAALIAERGDWIVRGPNEIVVREGDMADGFYVLAAGRAEVLQGGSRTALLRPGDYFGEVALLQDVPRTATVRTISPTRLFRIDGGAFRSLVAAAFRRGALPTPLAREATGAR
jgi:cAMP-dependent protein kinase regulator